MTNIIELIGYLSIYLFIGWIMLPIYRSALRFMGKRIVNISRKIFVISWPLSILAILVLIWGDGTLEISIFSGNNND